MMPGAIFQWRNPKGHCARACYRERDIVLDTTVPDYVMTKLNLDSTQGYLSSLPITFEAPGNNVVRFHCTWKLTMGRYLPRIGGGSLFYR